MKKSALQNSTSLTPPVKVRPPTIQFPLNSAFIRPSSREELEEFAEGSDQSFYTVLNEDGEPLCMVCGDHTVAFQSVIDEGGVPAWVH